MKQFDEPALKEFYSELSSDHGISVKRFLQIERELFGRSRSDGDVAAYRLGKGVWKKLRDEVVPVATFLRSLEQAHPTFTIH
ncbi:MAG: hypothetical protein P8011_13530 [Acidihalobacter sp.]|jgi:hypothetical protein|uniref:hypothetical protein n=1 Tax=Acidihalobacter sp. TaxID=1872108 RepID=UPI00307E6AD4